MSVDERKTLLKIRTFAQDQKNQQAKTGQPATEETTTPKKETGGIFETPKMSAPKATTHTVTVEKKSPKKTALEDIVSPAENKHGASKNVPTAIPKKIPAFHELQKEANKTISVRPRPAPKKTSSAHTPKKRDHHFTSTSTIITDNKKTGGNFFSDLTTSIDTWFASFKKKFKKKRQPKYIVQDTTRRKGVIQRATTKTGTLFTADNETLREEIRRRRLQEKKSDSEESEITWSPNTEVGYALLRDSNTTDGRTQNVQVSFKKRSVPEPTSEEIADTRWDASSNNTPKAPLPTPAQAMPAYEPTPIVAKEESVPVIENEVPAPLTTEEVETPLPTEPVVSSDEELFVPAEDTETISGVPEIESDEEYIFEESEATVPSESVLAAGLNLLRGKTNLRNTNTNVITIWATAIIAALIIIFIIGKGIVGILTPETTVTAPEPATPILSNATLVDFSLSDYSNSALTQAINQSDAIADSDLTEIRFLDDTEQPLRSQEVIDLFGLNINPNFNQSVGELHLASINHTEHAIVFTANDPTTVFGALLAWEEKMPLDLAPILDIPNVSTEARFIDKTILQSDVRILMDGENEVLVYGFLNKNIVLITTNIASFTKIAENQK